MATELIVIDKTKELEYFGTDGAQKALDAVKEHLKDFVPDITTNKGRKLIASNAAKIGKSRKLLDDMGKDIRASIQTNKNKRDELFSEYQTEFRKPLTDWEETEGKRIDDIKLKIKDIVQLSNYIGPDNEQLGSAALVEQMSKLNAIEITEENFAEFVKKATDEKSASKEYLQDAIDKRLKYESDQAELTRLREKEAADKLTETPEPEMELTTVSDAIDDGLLDDGLPEDHNEPFHAPLDDAQDDSAELVTADLTQEAILEQVAPVRDPAPIRRVAPDVNRENKRKINQYILARVIELTGMENDKAQAFVTELVLGKINHVTINYDV